MEFIATADYFILQPLHRSESALWTCRHTGALSTRPSWEVASQDDPECLGLTWGLVGKLRMPRKELCQRLVLVRSCERLGELPSGSGCPHAVYRVKSVAAVPISVDASAVQGLGLRPCPKHHPSCGEVVNVTRSDSLIYPSMYI